MKRSSRKRASRALIGVLGTTIVLGTVFYVHNLKKSSAAPAGDGSSSASNASSAGSPVTVAPEKVAADSTIAPKPAEPTKPEAPAEPTPLVTVTPTGPAFSAKAPTTAPAAATGSNATAKAFMPGGRVGGGAIALATAASTSTTKPAANNAAPEQQAPKVAAVSGAVPTLAEAKAKADAGQLLLARNAYNAALVSGNLSPADAATAKAAIAELNKSVVFSPRKYTEDAFGASYVVKSGDRMSKIAAASNVTWELLCKINGLSDPKKMRSGQTLKLIKGPFHAVVSKSTFVMDLYLGSPGGPDSMYVTSFAVGLGADDSTPTGTWQVEPNKKIKNPTYFSPRGEGVIEADDPKNPLGEFWLGLVGVDGHAVGKESYGIHGTIEPDSIGKMASMGCIRLVNENVAQVFDLLVEGKSTVVVKE